ncbi:MAG: hypothetical protein KY475_19450, partial [Planctomycetes bacterium]|nr:hypothetical protein [Planctomycetota bacterium]
LGLAAFLETRRIAGRSRQGSLQFRVRTLLIAMLVVALPLGLHQTAGEFGGALGFLISYAFVVGAALRKFHAEGVGKWSKSPGCE